VPITYTVKDGHEKALCPSYGGFMLL